MDRENIDPTGVRTDAELNSAMNLIHRSSSSSSVLKEKFKLDGPVSDNGSNFSAGERQLRKSTVLHMKSDCPVADAS